MSTSELERRLEELLHRQAEKTMNSTDTEAELDRVLDDTGRSARRRRRNWVVGGVAAVAAVAALLVWHPDLGTSKADPDPATPERRAERTAAAFVEAYGAFDRDGAESYLADDAALDIWTDKTGNDHWRRGNQWLEAAGTRIRLDKCDALWNAGTETYVSCVYDLHGLGSEQLGRGPYTDNTFSLTVDHGRIVDAAMNMASRSNGFYEEMWRPFAAWVTRAHPAAAKQMYFQYPQLDFASETPRSFALWRRMVPEYVAAQAGG
jgi:hypothetical protein